MTDCPILPESLLRPRLLIRAARAGLADYNRGRDLRKLTAAVEPPPPRRALALLIEAEDSVEARRKAGDASYSFLRHIELLIAILGEMRLLRDTQQA